MWDRIRRAEKQLESHSERAWYFALLCFDSDIANLMLPGIGRIQRVDEPPEPMFFQFASNSPTSALAVSRYARGIRYELVLLDDKDLTAEQNFTLAWQVTSAIRLSSLADLLIPAVCNYPWSTLPGIRDNRAIIRPLEDVPQAKSPMQGRKVTSAHIAWVNEHFLTFGKLLEVPAFRLASEALTTYHLQSSERMMAAHLWAGVEALVEVQAELRFRVAAYVASILEAPGVARRDLFKSVQKLYDTRSRAVHGSKIDAASLTAHALVTRELLGRLMRSCVERGGVPSAEEYETALFAPSAI
jgi:hypothetical protein